MVGSGTANFERRGFSRVSEQVPAVARAMNIVLDRRKAAGLPTFNMNQGLVRSSTSKAVSGASSTLASDELWRMGPVEGIAALRSEIARWRGTQFSTPISAANVLITCGANNAHLLLLTLLSDPGDLVLLPRPYFFNHANLIRQSNRALVSPKITVCRRGQIPVAHLSTTRLELLGADRAKYLLLSNPHNPTGARFAESDLTSLGSWCGSRGMSLVVDESYCGSESLGDRPSGWASLDSTIILGSLSKSVCLGDLRLGYVLASEEAIERMIRLQDNIVICPSVHAQEMALAVVRRRDELFRQTWQELRERSELLDWTFSKGRLSGVFGREAVFKWLRVPAGISDERFVLALAESTGVISTPGTAYGCPGYFRISYGMLPSLTDTGAAAERICSFFEDVRGGGVRDPERAFVP